MDKFMTKWVETIHLGDVWHNDDLSFTEIRDTAVARIKASRWYSDPDSSWGLQEAVDVLADQDDVEGFDYEWSGILDMADWDKVWIDTFSPRKDTVTT